MTALRVRDLVASVRFYRDHLSFTVTTVADEHGLALVDLGGYPVLLVGPQAADPGLYLHPEHSFVPAGASLYAQVPDPWGRGRLLAERGVEVRRIERWWGDRLLLTDDPDGFVVTFWGETERSMEETLDLYERVLDLLAQTISRLPEVELDLSCGPGRWSVRQIVHHLADLTAASYQPLMQVLAGSAPLSPGVPYNQDRWAVALHYAGRPISPSLAVLDAVSRQYIALMRDLPCVWERAAGGESREPIGAGRLVAMLAGHLLEHVEEIHSILRAHGVYDGRGLGEAQ